MSVKYVMKCIQVAHAPGHEVEGQYLKSMDWNVIPGGDTVFTRNKKEAMKFDSVEEALRYWKKVHPLYPIRPDGKPNRPLTAMTATFETIEDFDA